MLIPPDRYTPGMRAEDMPAFVEEHADRKHAEIWHAAGMGHESAREAITRYWRRGWTVSAGTPEHTETLAHHERAA